MPSALRTSFFRATSSLGIIFLSFVMWQWASIEKVAGETNQASQNTGDSTCPPSEKTGLVYAITGTESKDIIIGDDAEDILKGMGADDQLNGCAGNDRLEGGTEKDTLTGGKGSDHFIFNSNPSQDNTDTIVDFSEGENDKIVLDRSFFSDLPIVADKPTQLQPSSFSSSSTANRLDQRILFDLRNKTLYFDRDGSAEEIKPIPIAVLKGVESLSASSFLLEGKPPLSTLYKFGSVLKQNSTTLLLSFLTATSLLSLFSILKLPFLLQSKSAQRQASEHPRQDQPIESNGSSSRLQQNLNVIRSDTNEILQIIKQINQPKRSKGPDVLPEKVRPTPTTASPPKPPPPLDFSADALPSRSLPPATSVSDPAVEIAMIYQSCFQRLDRLALRNAATGELNITPASEEALYRGTSHSATQLEVVKGGGSYLLIERDQRYWLVPTFQTLNSFLTSQPAKGLFFYERGTSKTSELRRPAEVKQVEATWEVISMGLVSVP